MVKIDHILDELAELLDRPNAGEAIADPVIEEATAALKAGGGDASSSDPAAIFAANKELLTLHELIAHRLVQVLLGAHRGRTFH